MKVICLTIFKNHWAFYVLLGDCLPHWWSAAAHTSSAPIVGYAIIPSKLCWTHGLSKSSFLRRCGPCHISGSPSAEISLSEKGSQDFFNNMMRRHTCRSRPAIWGSAAARESPVRRSPTGMRGWYLVIRSPHLSAQTPVSAGRAPERMSQGEWVGNNK